MAGRGSQHPAAAEHGLGKSPKTKHSVIGAFRDGLGGIAGWDARETEAEDPDALEATRRLTLAWLRSTFAIEPAAWAQSQSALNESAASIAESTLK